jgi:WD40 repeat protein
MESGDAQFRKSNSDEYYNGAIWSLAGDRAAVICHNSARVAILDRSGVEVQSIATGRNPSGAAFSPDGELIAIVDGEKLQLCRSGNGQVIVSKSLTCPGNTVAFSHSGRRLAYGQRLGGLVVVDIMKLQTYRELSCKSQTNCLAFSPDDLQLATGHDDSIVRLWDWSAEQLHAELVGHERPLTDLAFTRDGRTLLSAAADGVVRLWSVEHCRGYGAFCRRVQPGSSDNLCRLSLSADGRCLVVGYRTQRKDCPDALLWSLDSNDRN